MKTVEEQIKVMQHYANGGEVETLISNEWKTVFMPGWNWNDCDFRIKEQKNTITIEKWLCKNLIIENNEEFWVCETSNIDSYIQYIDAKKVKLIETYEVEL